VQILHLSTSEWSGGAARAAHGLHSALIDAGAESRMLVLQRQSDDARVGVVAADRAEVRAWSVVEERWIARMRTPVSNTFFSLGGLGARPAESALVGAADVLNLHWISGLASIRDVGALLSLGKPVVWTLHDEWAFTGGCHYASGCERWRTACESCPQLSGDPYDLVEAGFVAKGRAYRAGPLAIVAPSRWLAARAGESALLGGCRIACIPYGVDVGTFTPTLRAEGRAALGVRDSETVVLFSADAAAERRKGFAELQRALMRAHAVLPRVGAEMVRFAVLGETEGVVLPSGAIAPGRITDRRRLASIVAASDLYVLPSLEDNLPNGILEALACGTPCVAFDTGGVPDMLSCSPGSELVPVGDADALGAAIARAIGNVELLRTLRPQICDDAVQRYSPQLQARSYLALYKDLIHAARGTGSP
jgi:glycosyltransferase involved in cell wall biosynthesis